MSMFGICVESSHQRGMGHFFRALNMIDLFTEKKENYILFVNGDESTVSILKQRRMPFEIVDLNDFESDWETKLIKRYQIDAWINDRLNTEIKHAGNIKKNSIGLVSFDDRGSGAELTDINFGSLPYNFNYNLKGARTLKGIEYLALNKKISEFRRLRKKCDKVAVTLGGSDTYGVTSKVVRILKNNKIPATVLTGPGFKHWKELNEVTAGDYKIMSNVPSLIEVLSQFDLAITGGGVTPFEANAMGLPCIIIANELEEVNSGFFLEEIGSSIFAGYYEEMDADIFKRKISLEKMSNSGLDNLGTSGAENIYGEIKVLCCRAAAKKKLPE